jgi:hypothetical protein
MKRLALAALLAASALAAVPAHAGLTLTQAGIDAGFNLSTFWSGNTYYGVLQATTMANGKVLATNYSADALRTFNNVDGQTDASALQTKSLAGYGSAYGVATVGGHTYFSPGFGGTYYEVDQTTLALTALTLQTSVTPYLGLWANQVTGHLLSSSYSGIVDIDPITGNIHVVTSTYGFDGVSVSNDGKTVYGALGSQLMGYDILTGAQVLNVFVGHGLDGTGVIAGSAYDGFIVTVNNDGTLILVNPATGELTTIANGGGRGDFAGVDLDHGQLFASFDYATYRLGIAGGTIGGGNNGVPEPATWAMMIGGLAMAGMAMRRRKVTVRFA